MIQLSIRNLGSHGEGVGTLDGFTFFVEGALPGEKVDVEVLLVKKTYGTGKLLRIIHESPDRVKPVCPLFARCGGCQIMHLDYQAQLAQKRQRVVDAFHRIGKLTDVEISPCQASPAPLYYRNKVQAPIKQGKNGIRVGFYARNSHDLVDVDTCYIHCELGQEVYETATELLKSSGISAYDWKSLKGELRHLIVKTAVNRKEALVVIVTRGKATPSLEQVAEEICQRHPEVKGVIQNINPSPHNVVLGRQYVCLAGGSYMEEEILGLLFRVSPASFFQVNPWQARQLYQQVIDWAALKGTETVLDAYCGVGTLSLLLAREAKQVIGVECVQQAIDDAEKNAALNEIENVTFVCAEAEKWIQHSEPMDLVVLNPPRKGCDPEMIQAVGKMQPPKVLYVSCDPATLARDLAGLREYGYQIDAVQPFDMFPQTAHVETVVMCSKSP